MRLSIVTFLACVASAAAFLPVMPASHRGLTRPSMVILKSSVSDSVRSIILKNTGDDPKVSEYLSNNADDKAEFTELGFDSLDMVSGSSSGGVNRIGRTRLKSSFSPLKVRSYVACSFAFSLSHLAMGLLEWETYRIFTRIVGR